jgi:hypothetical protein
MKPAATMPGSDFPANGHHPAGIEFAESQATRYLSAAAYLRRAMLPDEITELGRRLPRPPLPVGRAYAWRVLFRAPGYLPMSAVHVDRVRKHCRSALWQTFIRDGAALAALICAASLAPWGTAIALGIILLITLLVGRVRLSSPLVLAVVLGVTLALVTDGIRERASFLVPLVCLGACFLIYMADILWSARQVRKLWPSVPLAEAPAMSIAHPLELAGPYYAGPGGQEGAHGEPPPDVARQVYYDKDGIVGAGTPFLPLPLTVPLDKPRDADRGIREFTAPELQRYISGHLLSQGPRDGQRQGYAGRPLPPDGEHPGQEEDVHFTYGLPYLDVGEIVAVPLPTARKLPLLPVRVLPLQHADLPPARDAAEVAGRSPSAHPERHYVRAMSASWDGQLVASVYVGSALQGHYLRVNIRPYVLGPIVSDLKAADEVRERHPLAQVGVAAGLTLRQFVTAARKFRRLTGKQESPPQARPVKRGLLSIRELYAQPITDNVHQAEDADRILRVMELKVIRVTMDYLRECNVDVGEFETHITTHVQTNTIVGTGNIITGGTVRNGSVNATNNQGNAQPGGEGSGQ